MNATGGGTTETRRYDARGRESGLSYRTVPHLVGGYTREAV